MRQQAVLALKRHVDWPVRMRPGPAAPVPPYCVYVVYRRRNADQVLALAEASGAQLVAWALDEVAASLQARTVGCGAGAKFELLDRMIEARPPRPGEWVVVADDDVRITRGSIGRFLQLASSVGADLAQPAHDRRSEVNYGLTVSRLLTRVRETSFVEIGPLFAMSPAARERIVPFGEVGMGYGLEQRWYNLSPRPRFAIVDEVRMRHLVPAGTAYDNEGLAAGMADVWRASGALIPQPQQTLATWHAWSRRHGAAGPGPGRR